MLTNQLRDGARVLDVGSGSGYLTACMAHMVSPRGRVIGVDHIPELIEISKKNLQHDCPSFIEESRVKFIGIINFFLLFLTFVKRKTKIYVLKIFI